jgi:hypothetical protein
MECDHFSAFWSVYFVKLDAKEVGWIFPAISQILARFGRRLIIISHRLHLCDRAKSSHQVGLDQIDCREQVLIVLQPIMCILTFPVTRPIGRNFSTVFEISSVPLFCRQGTDCAD